MKDMKLFKSCIAFQEEIVAAVGKEKAEVRIASVTNATCKLKSSQPTSATFKKRVQVEEKSAREAATEAVKDEVTAVYEEQLRPRRI